MGVIRSDESTECVNGSVPFLIAEATYEPENWRTINVLYHSLLESTSGETVWIAISQKPTYDPTSFLPPNFLPVIRQRPEI